MKNSTTNLPLCNGARRGHPANSTINYSAINQAARANALELCRHLLPHGRRCGREYEALNPTRADRSLGSFRINLVTGKWADFATGDRGRDFVSFVAYVRDLRQSEAAQFLAAMFDLRIGGHS